MTDIISSLNQEQKKAVLTTQGPILILAGPGAGKTRVLTSKIAYLIKEKNVSEYRILAFTFTNKAANEMKDRVSQVLDKNVDHMWIGTFHSICSRILRREIHQLGYDNNFTIYDSQDQRTLLKQCIKDLKLKPENFNINQCQSIISGYKNKFVSPEMADKNAYSQSYKEIAAIYKKYEEEKFNNNALDFDDLILKTMELFKKDDQVKKRYAGQFEYVFVDEYQDTNQAQYELIKLFSSEHKNVCVVGDSDQSIYSWRGADIRNILNFEKDFKDAKVFLIEQNYRSTKNIIELANKLIENNKERKNKHIWTENEEGERVVYKKLRDENQEADEVIAKIKSLEMEGFDYSEMAILYRTNAQSRKFEEKLMFEAIPYKVVGGLKFYDRKEVKDMLAYLQVLINPEDDLSMERIINVPARGIGVKTLEKIQIYSQEMGQSIMDTINDRRAVEIFAGAVANKLSDLKKMFDQMKKSLDQDSLLDLIQNVYKISGYKNMLESSDKIEDKSRIENIESLINSIAEYEDDNPDASLYDYLQTVSLLSDVDKTEDENGVSLMTVHSAKGLEYDVVFLTGLEDGLFPSKMTMEEGGLEEERRLCYVAITRARKRLYLTSTAGRMRYGRYQASVRSRFIDEVEDLIEDKTENDFDSYDYSYSSYNKGPIFGGRSYQSRENLRKKIRAKIKEEYDKEDFKLGDIIEHKKFGRGMVVQVKEGEKDQQLLVSFDDNGIKRLSAKLAPIKKI